MVRDQSKSDWLLYGTICETWPVEEYTACSGEPQSLITSRKHLLSLEYASVWWYYRARDCRRCALNTTVQMVAAMPGVQPYLQQLCSRGGSASLKLHRALQQQLEMLAVAYREGKATDLRHFLQAMDDVDDVSWLCERDSR